MEAEVDKLELMFQKADSDLDYIQYRLEYEIKTNHPDTAGKRNPVTLLKELSTIKSRYQTLYARFKPIGIEQKESKNRICATVSKTMTMIQELQKQTDVELSPLTKEEKTAAEQLKSFVQTYEEVDLQKGILMERRSIPERFKKMSC
ncbi:spindle and kinetochore-associated protein 2 isoform X3 [Panthera pardus]|uniref:Protein FAM33A n=1 Tax=Panthera pardus TaxID=9691 RepID=A0A9V1ER35_PANPR|nr:spindle and kinetochore-associated protein 2 isoform X3 [Panthera pardus]